MYTLKSIIRRTPLLGTVLALAIAPLLPVSSAFADALNPLTERSLTLSSSSPGWAYTDGSGNSTYAPPNSGANGQKTGNYFSFKTSSAASVKTMSFQYCTTSAGKCMIPGNDVARGTDTATTSDLNVKYDTAAPVSGTDFSTVIDSSTGNIKAVPGYTNNNPKYSGSGDPAEAAKAVAGNFIVMYYDTGTSAWVPSNGWTASATKVNDGTDTGTTNNYIVLTNASGQSFAAGQQVKVLFFATNDDYITNPGAGAFFVKINTYGVPFKATSPTSPEVDITGLAPATDDNVIDGGVTVANVMNQSIQITTKVLETMQFSVGTVDPDTMTDAELAASDQSTTSSPDHGTCDPILTRMTNDPNDPKNVLQLGDQNGESSLSTDKAYATHSYWRLSSNSSAGATVYYSGHTLSNTVGDEIRPIGTAPANSHIGSEQFGLAIATTPLPGTPAAYNTGTYGVNYAQDRATDANWENAADNGKTAVDDSTLTKNGADLTTPDYSAMNASYHTPRLDPLTPAPAYSGGSGTINGANSASGLGTNTALYDSGVAGSTSTPDTKAAFAFDSMSDTVPAPIASESSQVVDCVTAKMRYVGNIAATTPAGIYTTKINYIAAPQY